MTDEHTDDAATPTDATPTGAGPSGAAQAAEDRQSEAAPEQQEPAATRDRPDGEAPQDDSGPDPDPEDDDDLTAAAAEGGEAAEGEDLDAEPDYDQLAEADPRTPGELLRALEEAGSARDEYLDALQRSRAEFDNFRKRSAREAAGARHAGVGDLAQQLLDVLDDLDRTADVAEQSEDSGLAGGIQAIHRKLVDVLRSVGVERIDETGVPFDATRHEAVQQVPAEEPLDEPEVVQVLRPGYLHGDRVLRAAMVSVRQ